MEKFNVENNHFKATTVKHFREFLKSEKERNVTYKQCSVRNSKEFLIEPGIIYTCSLDQEKVSQRNLYWIVYKSEEGIQYFGIWATDWWDIRNRPIPPTINPVFYDNRVGKKLCGIFDDYTEYWTYYMDDGYRQAKIIKSLKKKPLINEERFIQQFQEEANSSRRDSEIDVHTETLHQDLLALQEQELLIIDEKGYISLSAHCDKLMENNKYIYLI